MAIYLAEHAGVRVKGVTLSTEQLRVARETAKRRGLSNLVQFELQDYREIQESYDRVVSVGMFEHVGRNYYADFFNQVYKRLKSGGLALLHSIGSPKPPCPTNSWITRHIFPGGYIPSLSDVMPSIEASGLDTTDIEVLRLHYAYTLREWYARFARVRSEFVKSRGEKFCRMWELYLIFCQTAFELGELVVFQWQLGKPPYALPIRRDYLYGTRTPENESDS